MASSCASCGASVELWAARPRVLADGRVELECTPCARGERPVAPVEPPPPIAIPARRRRSWATALAGGVATVAALCLIGSSIGERSRSASASPPPAARASASVAAIAAPAKVTDVAKTVVVAKVAEVAEPPAPSLPPLPDRDGEPIDEWFPTLADWVHPVPGSPDIVPHQASRFFGAGRTHHDEHFGPHPECGGGHCGVDLEGVRGQTVVAVAEGTIVRIQPDDVGDGGRYVRIEHPDFVYTSYFHLDRIAPGLKVGDEIQQGAPVGALGASGIHVSMPHLHFALELPPDGADGSDGNVKFVDPVPYLLRAHVLARKDVADLPVDPAAAKPAAEAAAATTAESAPEQ